MGKFNYVIPVEVFEEAVTFLHDSHNKTCRSLLGRIHTCLNYDEGVKLYHEVESTHDALAITDDEYRALRVMLYNVMTGIRLVFNNDSMVLHRNADELMIEMKNRVWLLADVSKVMQFRNIITDMSLLGALNFDEYVELNNEIDNFIQYTVSNTTE